ncbi:hypothetical protein E4U53_005275 [Claviceps sorghi]|nr:hypothetical protein E4U53_005275 [Claviceps sorghi]
MARGAAASHHRHAHEALFKRHGNESNAICTPSCTTIYHTYLGPPTFVPINPATNTPTFTSAPAPHITPAHKHPVPPPVAHYIPTAGDYTFDATTITVHETKTICPNASGTAPALGSITPGPHSNGTIIIPPGIYVAPKHVVHATVDKYVYYCPFTRHHLPTATSTSNSTLQTPIVPPPPPPPPSSAPVKTQPAAVTSHPAAAPPASVSTQSAAVTSHPAAAAPPPASVKTQSAAAPSQPAAAPPPPPPASVKTQPAAVSSQAAVVPTTPATSQPSNGNGGLKSDNDHFGLTYTPYHPRDGSCKSAEEVEIDIGIIKGGGFTTVRIYSPECNALQTVGNACKKHGISMIVGVFVKASGCDINTPDIKLQVDQLAAWNNWDLVSLVVVGNEAIMNNHCSPQQLASLVVAVKERCSSKYKGHFTISETLNIWLRHDVSSAICPIIPVTGANIHSFFNSAIAPEMSGVFVKAQLDILATICPGNEVINLECGYPSGGKPNGLAIPGPSQQAVAIKSIRKLVGNRTVFFSFQNDLWKGDSACECEDKFGLAPQFGMTVAYN